MDANPLIRPSATFSPLRGAKGEGIEVGAKLSRRSRRSQPAAQDVENSAEHLGVIGKDLEQVVAIEAQQLDVGGSRHTGRTRLGVKDRELTEDFPFAKVRQGVVAVVHADAT